MKKRSNLSSQPGAGQGDASVERERVEESLIPAFAGMTVIGV
jgi:hypothetical protein